MNNLTSSTLTKEAKDLVFISRIKRDGTGIIPVGENLKELLASNPVASNETYKVFCLSKSQNTYIAIGFNSYVVKLK